MRSPVIVVLLSLGGLLFTLVPSPAEACGTFMLEDVPHKRQVVFYVQNTLVSPKGKKRPLRSVLRLGGNFAEDLHILAGRRKDIYFLGDTLRRGKRVLGVINQNTFTLGKTVFTINIQKNPDRKHSVPIDMWLVRVQKGDQVVLQGKAMSLCVGFANAPSVEEWTDLWLMKSRLEVRNRVLLYLAWRQMQKHR